ncbi:MAG: fructosamine kinase family protein [Chlamydiae bacterium]|nr:fructosamine kinase family protein [Chlamydiota bacterium]
MNLSSSFIQTISNTFGSNGQTWLQNLPNLLLTLKEKWQLSNISPIPNMSYHYVAKAIQHSDNPVVLKIGCDKQLMLRETSTLEYFDGVGAVKIVAFEENFNALLLEQAIPGHSLKSLYPLEMDRVMNAYATVVHNIDRHPLQKNEKQPFPSVAKWLDVFDRAEASIIDHKILQIAKNKRDALLSTVKHPKLLHGDLHLDNILENQGEWICIDPQGVVGEIEFEVAAFDIFAFSEIETVSTHLFLDRIDKLAKATNLDPNRLKDWFLVRLVLSAVWSIEDKGDPSKALKLAALLTA